MARPRNNITKLPLAVRERICELLDDNVEYDAVRRDPAVAAALADADLKLHGTTFLAYQQSEEYQEYRRCRRQWQADFDRRRMAAHLVNANHAIASQADLAAYLINARTLELLDDVDAQLDTKDLAALARAVKAAADRQWTGERAELQARIAELSARIVELGTGGGKQSGLSEDTLRQIEERVGLL